MIGGGDSQGKGLVTFRGIGHKDNESWVSDEKEIANIGIEKTRKHFWY